MRYFIYLLLNLTICVFFAGYAFSAPSVVTTILPLHALTAGVMGNVAAPTLLIKGGNSPHSYSLRPSDAKALSNADLIIWVGTELESFLAKPLVNLSQKSRIITLIQQQELIRLPQRVSGVWEHHDEHGQEISETGHSEKHYNPHLWLDPQNAIRIVRLVTEALIALDQTNRTVYQSNALDLEKRLLKLDQELDHQLQHVKDLPYLVFHDAYPYFEHRYNMHPLGAISINPERRTGAKRIAEIRNQIKASNALCVFSEPQFKPQLVQALISGTTANAGILDPLGADLSPGQESYFVLLRRMGENLSECLQERP